mmetsp:Transcript_57047/g.107172  ORF Transcript_57047/g.107172 Transcript_57047/m.107172 type:complete len:352 (+) Transcript_57047:103-1158(+)
MSLEVSTSDSDIEHDEGMHHIPHAPQGPRSGRPQAFRRPGRLRKVDEAHTEASTSSNFTCLYTDEDEVAQIDRDDLTWMEKVGTGITAEVFRGTWKGQTVAIKQLNLTKRTCMMVKQQVAFCRETNVAAKIRHANLVQFHGVSFDCQPYLMITEFMSGGTVFELLHCDESVELQWRQQLRMCSDVASAMDYLHKFKPQIIHRDLKSLNLLLSKAIAGPLDVPEVKVSDFGLAKMKEDTDDWGKMTAAAGTFHWMAPEVHTGHYNEKADVYSYAMVLYEIICCEVPFQDLEAAEVPAAVSSGTRPDLDCVPDDCPDRLKELMILCWAQDHSQRPSFTQILTVLNATISAHFG